MSVTVTQPEQAASTWQDVFIGRQPILDRSSNLLGYELLFRDGAENCFGAMDPDQASAAVISNSFFVVGIEALTGSARAFVNFTRSTLMNDYAFALPRDRLVVEILEDVPADAEVLEACHQLKRAGYLIALDDFNLRDASDPGSSQLLSVADYVKIDFMAADSVARERYAREFRARGVPLVAEKVERQEDVDEALRLGYSYLQGYFFARPEVRVGRRALAIRANRLEIMRELNRPEPNMRKVEELFKHDPDLTYRLLRHLNSAAFAFRSRIPSIWRAIMLLGERGMRAWTMVVVLADLGRELPSELVVMSVVRARFCELVAEEMGLRQQSGDLFLMGLFSMLDTITGLDMKDVMAELPLTEETQAALLGEPNRSRSILNIVRAYERSQWLIADQLSGTLGLHKSQIPRMYAEAVDWGNKSRQAA